jgi:hypothetical protein
MVYPFSCDRKAPIGRQAKEPPDNGWKGEMTAAILYRKLKEKTTTCGHSVRELVLAIIRSVLLQDQRPNRVQFPLIVSEGPKVAPSSEQIYEYVEFP